MRTPVSIPDQVRRKQTEASDPGVSAWVAANAGAGKTHVLVQRVINLLLNGVEPEKILCITFTKAAAANMAKRVFDTLAKWITYSDAELDAAIRGSSDTTPDARRRALARQLFACALETPGGLKVQTIHGFCTQLLHQFPFEANVAARFSVLDEAEQSQLLERLTLSVLLDGARNPGSALADALDTAMTAAADQTFRDVVREAIGRRDAIDAWVVRAGSLQKAVADLSALLGVNDSDRIDDIEAAYFSGQIIAPPEWPAIAKVLALGRKSDCEQAARLVSLATQSGPERIETYLDIFCTGANSGRSPRVSIVTSAIKDAALAERLGAEQDRVYGLLLRRRAVFSRDRSVALLTVAQAVLTRYYREKERRGLLDYDDLIDKALALLSDFSAAWVHYKLDLGIDHVLVDEAQDTSSKQWDIVRRLTAEFTAGEGARSLTRTMFAVGDEKQSIYSFQKAAPREFAEMQRHFKSAHEKSGLDFVVSKFEHSFRSGEAILEAVDAVFKLAGIAASVTSDPAGFPPHIPLPNAPPSMVEIWEPEKPDPRDENKEGWDAPFDTVSETSPRVKLARRIARTVRRLVDEGAASYGDVLVLVRQRGELFEAIIRALKNRKIDVAGADRLMLTEHIAVMDLMALADALLLPEDDLALATVLRSPLFGFSDDELFGIAWDRGRSSLRDALVKKAAAKPVFAEAAARLDELAQAARQETPFGFYARLLGAGGARRRFLSRLDFEANDAIDEFLNVAFDYERRETPSLQGFLTWLRDARAEVKRDMEIRRDEVRVMTVHGAKGLEASVVILADTITPPVIKPPRLLQLAEGATIWAGRKADDVDKLADARTRANSETEHEYRRLLYVAMTRAADRLIVCGAEGERGRSKGCWYNLVREPLKPLLVEEEDGGDKVWRFRKPPGAALAPTPAAEPAWSAMRREFPVWLREDAPLETPRLERTSPSSAFEEEIGRTFARSEGSVVERRKALARGRIVHRLLQSVPDIPEAARNAAIERYLNNAAVDFSSAERTEMARQVLAILSDLVFAEVFAQGSRAEVPIVGRVARRGGAPIGVSGQVDRLAVTRDSVLIADYKTDRAVPREASEIPPAYVAQLALYRAVLSRIYPNRTICAALLYTAGPRLIGVPDTAMDTELAEILRQKSPAGNARVRLP
jgi:ATP-dependent helicase/nuclease subunit A